ncbi:MAG TPA: hypothetical protein VJC11_02605 [Patescibacteria group bacterium]|nr:hypothetical protein [Patescibacteria group bacterium]
MIDLGQKIQQRSVFLLSFFTLFLFGFLAGIAPSVWSGGYLTTPDAYVIVANAQHILDQHQMVPRSVYQFFQILTAAVSFLTGATATQAFTFVTGLATALLAIVTFFLGRTMFRSDVAGLLSGFFAISLPFISSAIVLTPQNIFGFLFFVWVFYALVRFLDARSIRRGVAFVALSILLLAAHPLSFGVFLIVLGVYFPMHAWRRFGWKMRIVGLVGLIFFAWLGTTLISFILTGSFNPIRFLSRFLIEISTTGLGEPIILFSTYAQVFGGLTIFLLVAALFVSLFSASRSVPRKWLILSLFAVPLVWANFYLLGVNFLSYRVILFLWLPASILITYFLLWYTRRGFSKMSVIAVSGIIIVSFSIIGFQSIWGHYEGYGKNFVPSRDDQSALKWFDERGNSSNQILTIERWPQIQNNIFGYLYPGLGFFVVTDLTESLEPPKPPIVSATEPSSTKLLGKFILEFSAKDIRSNVGEFNDQVLERRKELFYGSKFPDSERGKRALDEWRITHAYLYKNIQEYKFFKESPQFTLIYENDTVGIFQRVAPQEEKAQKE